MPARAPGRHLLAVLVTGALLGGTANLGARDWSVRFDHLSIDHGLSQATVSCILQDRRGFMWFGTQDGLNRFDGYSFTVFKHDPAHPESLSHNWVSAILEDRKGAIWVGTRGGLDRLDPATGAFSHFRNDPSDPHSLSHNRVRAILEDREGTLWIGTEGGGLERFDPSTGAFVHHRHDPNDPLTLAHDHVRALHEDRKGALWVGTEGGGLDRLERSSGVFSHYRHQASDPASLSDDRVLSIHEDREGALWVGTREGGVDVLDPASGRFAHHRNRPADPSSLSTNSVPAIHQDSTGTLWIGTEGGLNRWSPADGSFVRYRNDPVDPRSLSDDQVTALYEDRGGVLWVGTGAGLSKRNIRVELFPSFRAEPRGSGLSSGTVMAFAADRQGRLWIGTFGGGLNRFDPRTSVFSYYRHRDSDPSSLGDDRVTSLLVDKEGTLWVGTFAGGLDRFDGERFLHHWHVPTDPGSLSSNGVSSLCEGPEGALWVGTYGGGLNRLDRRTRRFVRFRRDPSQPSGLSHDRVQVIYADREGILWIGTDGGGLNRFDPRRGEFAWFRHDAEDPTSLSSDSVLSIHEDRHGALWVGTDAGLNHWSSADRRAGRSRFERLGKREGLPNEVVYGILSDRAGDLWLSTVKGLSRFRPATQEFKNYNPSHGLQSYEFNFGAYYRSPGGEMFFGGVNGFNAFHPDRIRENTYVPPVVLTGFWKSGQKVSLDRPLWETDRIELSYRDYVVSFEFAALDYTAPEQNRYAYKLEGLDQTWIDLGTLRRATYTNLSPGRYVLRVRGSNNDGVWNEEGVAALRLHVIPSPWKTWWAYLLYVVAAAGVAFGYVRAQARRLAREEEYSRRLARQVQERTQELEERTRELADSNRELQVVNLKLEEAALTDPATGLKNRRFLMTHIQEDLALVERDYEVIQEISGQRRSRSPDFLFLMIDLDGFKEINDVHGHDAGDLVLLQVCDLLKRVCRKSDTIIRWGGDEFMIVGRGVHRNHAEVLADRIRWTIEETPFVVRDDHTVRLTGSIGYAFYPFVPRNVTLLRGPQIVTIADRALYLAKLSGRNAWVGIHSTERTPQEDLVRLLNEQLERLVREGAIEIRTSIPDPARLRLARD